MDAAYGSLPPTAQKRAQAPKRRLTALDLEMARRWLNDPKAPADMVAWAKGVMGGK